MPKTLLPRTDATPKQNEGHHRRNNCAAVLVWFTALDKGSESQSSLPDALT